MQQMLKDKGIRIWSVHLPFGNDEWSDLGGEEEVRKRSTNHYIRTLRLCATHFPDCRTFVTHGSKGTLTPRSKSVGQTRKALKELVPVANELGVRLCVENLEPASAHHFRSSRKYARSIRNCTTHLTSDMQTATDSMLSNSSRKTEQSSAPYISTTQSSVQVTTPIFLWVKEI
jgi:sugar phosphate isomerase/epimerase